jgi:ribosome maturation factor RimP
MIDRNEIEKSVREYISGTGIFLVSVKVSNSNRIMVLADTNKGITIDECVDLHRHIEKSLNRDIEDFELQVSSPGLEMPFLVLDQYYKNEGTQVAVIDNEGMKHSGVLKNVTPGGFELETTVKVKGQPAMVKDLSFNFEQVKSTKIVLTIK